LGGGKAWPSPKAGASENQFQFGNDLKPFLLSRDQTLAEEKRNEAFAPILEGLVILSGARSARKSKDQTRLAETQNPEGEVNVYILPGKEPCLVLRLRTTLRVALRSG
jgi:hypothetical protein